MDAMVKAGLEQARAAAVQARALAGEARRLGAPDGEVGRRVREIDRLEDVGRSAVLECLEAGDLALAADAAGRLAETLADEGERAARALVLARRGAVGP